MQTLAIKNTLAKYLPKRSGKLKDFEPLLQLAGRSVGLVFLAYILASIVSSIMLLFFASVGGRQPMRSSMNYEHPRIERLTNYRDLRVVVVGRNIFNSEGILPDEPEPTEGAGAGFNPDDKCQKPTLNVELLGIIATGNPDSSLATILEKGYTIADIYRAGDTIIGQDQALIYSVEEDMVVLNNRGVKECLELNTVKPKSSLASNSPSSGAYGGSASNSGSSSGEEGGADCPSGTVSLESSYVEESLGPGFSKILEVGRLVPFHRDGAMIGFKLIGVRGGSIWSRSNLGSGDVITAVNGTSMAQPEKGFAVYESLQTDKQLRVEFLKSGKSPCFVNIEIK